MAFAVGATERAFALGSSAAPAPAIDAHIHLFNPTRPGGVPWPLPDDMIYRPAMPERFAGVTANLGVVGAIAIEASPLAADNDWLLQVVERSPIMIGMVGDLVPGAPEFRQQLDRLSRNPLYLGIRYGNLWDRNLALDCKRPGFMQDMRYLAQAGLVFETANPDAELVQAALSIAERIPELTIVMDHLPNARVPQVPAAEREFRLHVRSLGVAPRVYTKLSEVIEKPVNGVHKPAASYTEKLEELWQAFGPEKLLYGSDWPNSDHIASYQETFSVARNFIHTKGEEAARKFFFANSQSAYRWKPRRPDQQATPSRMNERTAARC